MKRIITIFQFKNTFRQYYQKKTLIFLTMDDAHGVPHQVLGRVRPQQRGRGQQQEEQGQDRK